MKVTERFTKIWANINSGKINDETESCFGFSDDSLLCLRDMYAYFGACFSCRKERIRKDRPTVFFTFGGGAWILIPILLSPAARIFLPEAFSEKQKNKKGQA